MLLYYLNLLNIDFTHPGLRSMLVTGGLSVRRSSKTFARTPVDLTLEQTVNADAASCMTGIAAFSQLMEARRRLMITHSTRSAVIGHLLCLAGMKKDEDFTRELANHRIVRDNTDRKKIISCIQETMNPFDTNTQDDKLYCLSTGKATSDAVKK